MFYVFVLFYVASVLMLYMYSSLIGSTASVTIQFLKKYIFYTSVPGADSAPDLCSIFSQSSVFLDKRQLHKCA